jgi:predicted porin
MIKILPLWTYQMKNSFFALAVLSASVGAVHAQASVTVYGSFDAGIRNQNNQDGASHSRTTMNSAGTYNSNRLGFKGIEPLGGGLNAHFTLETGFLSGSGAQGDRTRFFNRSAFVGLGGEWGAVDLGRQFTVAYKTVGAYDPFNFKYTNIVPLAQASVSAGVRNDNAIQYTGTFGPLTARAEYALGEQAGGGSKGGASAVGATLASGPFSVGAAYTRRKPNVDTAAAPDFQDNTHYTVGGAYTFGPARVAAGYAREKQGLAARGDVIQKNAWIGGSYDFSKALGLTVGYYDTKAENFGLAGANGKRQLLMVGATYALSKRTNFYADVDYAKYKNGLVGTTSLNGLSGSGSQLGLSSAANQDKQTGISVGINHVF